MAKFGFSSTSASTPPSSYTSTEASNITHFAGCTNLGDDELCVFGGPQSQLGSHVMEGDPRVSKRDGPNGRLDNVVVESQDQGECMVALEALGVVVEHLLKPLHIPGTDS